MRRFLLVGLTGSIATGKSTVSRMFAHLGARVIDADLLAREVVMPGQAAYLKIVEEFGPEVVQADGTLDRKALGAIVFTDPVKRKRLEEITHPAIRTRQQRILSALDEEAFEGIVIWDVALLFESGGVAQMDRVIVAYDSDPEELVSSQFAAPLIRAGYRVSVLKGGIVEWLAANFPTDTKDAPKAAAPEPGSLKG